MAHRITVLGTLAIALGIGLCERAVAQVRNETDARFRAMKSLLDESLELKIFLQPMTLAEFTGLIHEYCQTRGKDITIVVDTAAFSAADPDRFADGATVYNVAIKPFLPFQMKNSRLSIAVLLQQAIAQIPDCPATYVARHDHILITTVKAAHPERLAGPPARFDKKPLADALEELAEMSGATIIVDSRAGDKAKTPVTAAFRGTTTVANAARLLAESADLATVIKENVVFVTTRDNAERLREDGAAVKKPRKGR